MTTEQRIKVGKRLKHLFYTAYFNSESMYILNLLYTERSYWRAETELHGLFK